MGDSPMADPRAVVVQRMSKATASLTSCYGATLTVRESPWTTSGSEPAGSRFGGHHGSRRY
jgi:hypothetical protein